MKPVALFAYQIGNNTAPQGLIIDTRETVEQVRRSVSAYLANHQLPPLLRDEAFEKELGHQCYYQERNVQANKSHTKTRIKFYLKRGIDVDKIKSCVG